MANNEEEIKPPNLTQLPNSYINKHQKIVIQGGQRTGKTTLIKHILKYTKMKYDLYIIMSNNIENIQDLTGYIQKIKKYKKDDRILSYEYFNDAIIKEFIHMNNRLIEKNKSPISICLILDDLWDNELKTSKSLASVFISSRHIAFTCIYSIHDLSALSPLQRNNCEIFAYFKSNSYDANVRIARIFFRDTVAEYIPASAKIYEENRMLVKVQNQILKQPFTALISTSEYGGRRKLYKLTVDVGGL